MFKLKKRRKYKIHWIDNSYKEVIGQEIEWNIHPDFKFFIHRRLNPQGKERPKSEHKLTSWTITELSTGYSLGNNQAPRWWIRKDSIEAYCNRLKDMPVEMVGNLIRETRKKMASDLNSPGGEPLPRKPRVKTEKSKNYRLGPKKSYKRNRLEKTWNVEGYEIFQEIAPGFRCVVTRGKSSWIGFELSTGTELPKVNYTGIAAKIPANCRVEPLRVNAKEKAVIQILELIKMQGQEKCKEAIERQKGIMAEYGIPFPLNE